MDRLGCGLPNISVTLLLNLDLTRSDLSFINFHLFVEPSATNYSHKYLVSGCTGFYKIFLYLSPSKSWTQIIGPDGLPGPCSRLAESNQKGGYIKNKRKTWKAGTLTWSPPKKQAKKFIKKKKKKTWKTFQSSFGAHCSWKTRSARKLDEFGRYIEPILCDSLHL